MGYTVLLVLLTLITGGLCVPNTYLYFVDHSDYLVYRIDPAQPQREVVQVAGVRAPTAVAYDEQNDHVYVFNGRIDLLNTTKFILKYDFNSGSPQRLQLARSVVVHTLAVDPGSGLLYYADRTEKVIVAVTTDFRYKTVIIDTNLEHPLDLKLDTVNKAIYWCDGSSTFPYIAKANMDGSSRMNIVTDRLELAYAIALDVPEKKIYWVDPIKNYIERCNMDGTGRETFLSLSEMDPLVFSVAVDETYVYWIERWRGVILKKKKMGAQDIETLGVEYEFDTTHYLALSLVRTSPPPQGINACSGRGGCEHVCILTPESRVCRCSRGYILQPDGTSCHQSTFARGLVTVDTTTRVLLVLDLDTNIITRLTDTWYSRPIGLALDETTSEIFWTDQSRKSVFRTCIPMPCFQVVRTYNQTESYLGYLALDTQRKNIYVGDSGLGQISKMNYSGDQEEVIVSRGLGYSVRQIAFDTDNRKIYWATQRSIEVADMDDGSNQTVLISRIKVDGLALDTQAQKLYVLSSFANINMIAEVDLVGRRTQRIYEEIGIGYEHLIGLAVGDGMLYFGNIKDGSINEINIATQEVKKYGLNQFRGAVSIAYFNFTALTTTTPVPVSESTTPQNTTTTTPSGASPVNRTMVIALSVLFGGLIFIVGIVIIGVVIYKKISMSGTASTTPQALDLPLQLPSSKPALPPVKQAGNPKLPFVQSIDIDGKHEEYSEVREFSGMLPPSSLPPPPTQPPPTTENGDSDVYIGGGSGISTTAPPATQGAVSAEPNVYDDL